MTESTDDKDITKELRSILNHLFEEYQISDEVQKEALNSLSEVAKAASSADCAELDTIAKMSEARARVMTEALKKAESKEERKYILDSFLKADQRDAEERKESGQRASDTQRGIAGIAGKLIYVAAGATISFAVAGMAYAGAKMRE